MVVMDARLVMKVAACEFCLFLSFLFFRQKQSSSVSTQDLFLKQFVSFV